MANSWHSYVTLCKITWPPWRPYWKIGDHENHKYDKTIMLNISMRWNPNWSTGYVEEDRSSVDFVLVTAAILAELRKKCWTTDDAPSHKLRWPLASIAKNCLLSSKVWTLIAGWAWTRLSLWYISKKGSTIIVTRFHSDISVSKTSWTILNIWVLTRLSFWYISQ